MLIQLRNIKLKISFVLIFIILVFIIIGCSSGPDFAQHNYPGVIADNGSLLIHFNLSRDSIILNQFLSKYSDDDLSMIIDKTDRFSMSVSSLGKNAEFSILTEGKYPRTLTNLFMGGEKNWIKHKDNYIWWENKSESMYLSVPINSLALISSSDINSRLSFIESGKRKYIPEDVKREFENSAVTIYSRFPGSNLYESLNIPSGKMSVQELFFVIRKNGDNYNVSGLLEFLDESDAKIFSTLIKLGLIIKLRETGKVSVMKIVHDSQINAVKNTIVINNILLSPEEMNELIAAE